MTGAALRRAVLVVSIYIVVAWLVSDAAGWFRRVLALPALFETLLRGGLWLGAPMAGLLAWYYPSLGGSTGAPDEGPGQEPREPLDP